MLDQGKDPEEEARAKNLRRLKVVRDVLLQELGFCQRINHYHPRNYYMWLYRAHLLEKILVPFTKKYLLIRESAWEKELKVIRELVKKDPTDGSAACYSEKLEHHA